MKLRLMLWLLGMLLKRARRRHADFRERLRDRGPLAWGIATEDLTIARHYRLSADRVQSASGLPVDLDLELRFRDPDAALAVLRHPSPRTFRDGLIDGRLRLVGDTRDLERLQGLLAFLR